MNELRQTKHAVEARSSVMPIIALSDINKSYENGEIAVRVLR